MVELRDQARMTQEDLAYASGLHPNYIGDLERGERNPSLLVLIALSAGLQVSLLDLLQGLDS